MKDSILGTGNHVGRDSVMYNIQENWESTSDSAPFCRSWFINKQ